MQLLEIHFLLESQYRLPKASLPDTTLGSSSDIFHQCVFAASVGIFLLSLGCRNLVQWSPFWRLFVTNSYHIVRLAAASISFDSDGTIFASAGTRLATSLPSAGTIIALTDNFNAVIGRVGCTSVESALASGNNIKSLHRVVDLVQVSWQRWLISTLKIK